MKLFLHFEIFLTLFCLAVMRLLLEFFWGNMRRAAEVLFKTAVTTVTASAPMEVYRREKVKSADNFADKQVELSSRFTDERFKTREEMKTYRDQEFDQYIDDKTFVAKYSKEVGNQLKTFFDF
jgi:FtsZ-interacting cell division protein ZipA